MKPEPIKTKRKVKVPETDKTVRLKLKVHEKLIKLQTKLNKHAVPQYSKGDVVEYLLNKEIK